jgi:hypothetical protein
MKDQLETFKKAMREEMRKTIEPVDLNFSEQFLKDMFYDIYNNAQAEEQKRISNLLS